MSSSQEDVPNHWSTRTQHGSFSALTHFFLLPSDERNGKETPALNSGSVEGETSRIQLTIEWLFAHGRRGA